MKQRLKVDGVIIITLIVLSIGIYFFPGLFWGQTVFETPLFFVGLLLVQKGAFIRMAARGHKKVLSPKGWGLAKTGFYAYTRNPMYLGSFTVGLGFAMVIWPWWALPIFAFLFYLRFSPTIRLEEEHLRKLFGKEYEDYCADVPQFFPSILKLMKINKPVECPWSEVWSTKEQYGIWYLPVIVLLAKAVSDKFIYGHWNLLIDMAIFFIAVTLFWVHIFYEYNLKYEKNPKQV